MGAPVEPRGRRPQAPGALKPDCGYSGRMSTLPMNEPDEDDERPGPLHRMRPFAKIAFAIIVLPMIAGIVVGLCLVVVDIGQRMFPRREKRTFRAEFDAR